MTFFGILTVVAVGASLAACGSDTSTSSTTTGAGGSTTSTSDTTSSTGGSASTTTTTSTTSSTTTSTTTSSTTTSTSSGGMMLVNGCDPTKLEDHTNMATVEIKFGGNVGFKYSPPCIKVKSGTMVTFSGSLSTHPLIGGEIVNGSPMTDPKSPIKDTSSGTTVTFSIAAAGSYPYYCTDHYSSGMQGLIVAE